MTSSFIWLILVVAFLFLEAITAGLVSVWFAIGALFSLVTSLFTNSTAIQVVVFFAVSIILMLATLPLAKKYRSKKSAPTNAQRNIGRMGKVVVDISPQVPGRVKVDGVDWMAMCDVPLSAGQMCVVKSIHSTTFVVEPVNSEQTAKAN